MMQIRDFIRETNSLLLKMQSRTRSIKNYSTRETRNMNKNFQVRPTKDIPGPKALPLIGNLFRFIPRIGEYHNVNNRALMRMLRDKYGNIVKLDGIKEEPYIFLFCPELCKNMYQMEGKFPMRMFLEPIYYYRKNREDIYKGHYGLTLSQGESWKDVRSKVNPHIMRPEIIKMYITQTCDITNELVDKMSVLRDPETLELPNDFINEIYKWNLESTCSVAMNYRLGFLKSNVAVDSEPEIMINCLKEIFDLTYLLDNVPLLLKVYYKRNYQKLFDALDQVHAISWKYIKYAKKKILLSATADNTNRDYSIFEKLLRTDKQLALVMTLDMLLSIDTTVNAAGALLYYIANNKEKQEKLRVEVMSLLPDKTTPITHDILEKIPYVRGCIKESLRMFPLVNIIQRTMQTDVSLGGYLIPKGASVLACHSLLSLDPMYFARPMEYIPERWIRNSSEYSSLKSMHTYAYMPFGHGVRACIGQRLVDMTLAILVLKVIRNFQIEWHHGPLEHSSHIINIVKTPLRLKLIDL